MVSPGPSLNETKKIKRLSRRLAYQPVDLREGVAKAYSVVKEVKCKLITKKYLLLVDCIFLVVCYNMRYI